jgi:hypothetical protein
MNVSDLALALHQESGKRAYVTRLEVLDQSASVIKARLYISPELFIQVYRNDSFDTTNLVLIHNGQRVYARDQLGGIWHRHTPAEPHLHDIGAEGRQAATLAEFLDETEIVLAALGLP